MKKYASPITATLTPDNWESKINLDDMTLDDMTELLWDFKQMEKFSKKISGYMKQACTARLPRDTFEYVGTNFGFVLNNRVRAGSLNRERCIEDMGELWVENHSNPSTEYVELRVAKVKGEDE